MRVTCENIDGCRVAQVSGSIDAAHAVRLQEAEYLASPDEDVVLDVSEVDFLDSTGLGALVAVVRAFSNNEKRLILTSPPPIMLRTLELTGVSRVMEITDSMVDAIDALMKA